MAKMGTPGNSGGGQNNSVPSTPPQQPQKPDALQGKSGDNLNRGYNLTPSRDLKKDGGKPGGGGVPGKGAIAGAIGNAAANNTGAAGKAARGAQKVVEVTKKVANVVSKGGKLTTWLMGVLANPVTWMVLAAIVAVIAVIMGSIAALQTIGKNDTSDGCYGIGIGGSSSSIQFVDGETDEERAEKMMSWLLEQPSWEVNDGAALTKEQAAAIVGNFLAESRMNPGIIEMSAPNYEYYLDADNDRIDVWLQENTSQGRNIGIGLAQWTWNPGRAGDLLDTAREVGSQWYEIEPQLELIKKEMNGNYAAGLKAKGFTDTSDLSVEELSVVFHDVYEVSADTAEQKARRGEAAKDTLSNYTGGTTGGKSRTVSGGSCGRGSGSADMSTPTALAYSIAWPVEDYDKALTPGSFGKEGAKPEYIEAKEAAMEIQPEADVHVDLYASCDRVVATIIINTIDKDLPWGNVDTQKAYLESSDDWEEVPMSDRKEGDILINNITGSHVVYYVGEGEAGTETIVQGSHLEHVASVQDATYMMSDPGYKAFRFVGTPDSTGSGLVD